jgi:LytTr DNA-binding domain
MPGSLSQPFPFTPDFRKRIVSVFLISLFVFLFLFLFRPFGLDQLDGNLLLITIGYGTITFIGILIVTVIIPKLFPKFFIEERWTTGKELLFILITISLIASCNIIYSHYLGFIPVTIDAILNFSLFTFLVAIMPVFALTLIRQNILLRKNLKAANDLSNNLYHKVRLPGSHTNTVTIHSENGKDNFTEDPANIYFLKSAENYVEVHYSVNGKTTRKVLRTTLKSAHDDLKAASQFYRCHRTCLVNLEKVKRVTGNAQGYRLVLENVEESIPVSRGLNNEITLRLKR